jgi:hypothetical protein
VYDGHGFAHTESCYALEGPQWKTVESYGFAAWWPGRNGLWLYAARFFLSLPIRSAREQALMDARRIVEDAADKMSTRLEGEASTMKV